MTVCPHCRRRSVYHRSTMRPSYRCRGCGFEFGSSSQPIKAESNYTGDKKVIIEEPAFYIFIAGIVLFLVAVYHVEAENLWLSLPAVLGIPAATFILALYPRLILLTVKGIAIVLLILPWLVWNCLKIPFTLSKNFWADDPRGPATPSNIRRHINANVERLVLQEELRKSKIYRLLGLLGRFLRFSSKINPKTPQRYIPTEVVEAVLRTERRKSKIKRLLRLLRMLR